MRIAATADLHGNLSDVPECDVLVVGGDLGPAMHAYYHDEEFRGRWIREVFVPWCLDSPASQIVVVAGNHDFVLEEDGFPNGDYPKPVHYLEDSGIEIGGLKFWGSPWTPVFNTWAFMEDEDYLEEKWKLIPTDTDILITHGPPYGLADKNLYGEHCGSTTLKAWRELVNRLPLLHLFGHIHEGHGKTGYGWANVSFVNSSYVPANPIRVFDVTTKER